MMQIKTGKMIRRKHVAFKYVVGVALGLILAVPVLSQNTDLFPIPDSYQVEGIPAIKKSEVEHLFYDPGSIKSNLIWDADSRNRRLLVTDQTNNIYLLSSPFSQPVKLIEKVVPNSVRMHPNGQAFAYTSDLEDEDNFQLYLYDFEKKATRKLTTLPGKDQSIESFSWGPQGNILYYARIDYETKTSKICQHDLVTETCFETNLKGIWYVHDSGPGVVLLKHWKASSSQLLYIYEVGTNKLLPIDEEGNSRKAYIVRNHIIWTSEGNVRCKGAPCVLSLNAETKRITKLKFPNQLHSITDIKPSPNGRHLLVQETRDGVDNLRIFRFRHGKVISEIPKFLPGSFVTWNTRWLSDDELAYTLENIGKPVAIQSFNIESRTITDWTKEELPPQLDNKITAPEVIKWKSFDKREVSGYMVRPKGTHSKTPVLVYVHGGPQVLDRPVFNSQDIRLASNLGIAIIHTNVRGSSGFGNEFMNADDKEKRIDAVKDIQYLINWIEKRPDLDSKKIYLRGESYGGFVVLSTALNEPSRVKGVIAESPLVSIRGFLSQSWIDEFAKTEYGDPKDEKLMLSLDKLSPLNNTERWNKIPLLLTRGKRDSRNPEIDVVNLKSQLQQRSTEVWYIYSTEGGHGFGGRYVFASIFLFLKAQIQKED